MKWGDGMVISAILLMILVPAGLAGLVTGIVLLFIKSTKKAGLITTIASGGTIILIIPAILITMGILASSENTKDVKSSSTTSYTDKSKDTDSDESVDPDDSTDYNNDDDDNSAAEDSVKKETDQNKKQKQNDDKELDKKLTDLESKSNGLIRDVKKFDNSWEHVRVVVDPSLQDLSKEEKQKVADTYGPTIRGILGGYGNVEMDKIFFTFSYPNNETMADSSMLDVYTYKVK